MVAKWCRASKSICDLWHCCNSGELPPPVRKPGVVHVSTRGSQHKAPEQNWLFGGRKDQTYLSVIKQCNAKVTCG